MEPDSFCRSLYPRLVGSLRLSFGRETPAEDIAQEALARVIERWQRVAAMDHPEAWAYRVAFNLARSGFRRRRAETRANKRLAGRSSDVDDPAEPGAALDVRRAVAELPKRQRQAIVLRFYGDLTVDQVAAAMKCRPGTVKAHLHQGLVALRLTGLVESGPAPIPTEAEQRAVRTRPDARATQDDSRQRAAQVGPESQPVQVDPNATSTHVGPDSPTAKGAMPNV